MPAKISLVGRRFGRLKVLKEAPHKHYGNRKARASVCLCKCGNKRIIINQCLVNGSSQSCGCLAIEMLRKRVLRHGNTSERSPSVEYRKWASMIARCRNTHNNRYSHYGKRGISVCQRWIKFENFLTDMGKCPKGLTLERKNNSIGYCKSNCKWDTNKNQARNKTTNLVITIRGITACLSAQCERFDKEYKIVWWRIKNGWSAERAFFHPVTRRHR